MASFDNILAGLHANGSTSTLTDSSDVVTINEKRELELPDGYDTVLAYSGDINSQIVTFKLPETHEGHNLSGCLHKKLKWKNLSSGIDGTSDLVEVKDEAGNVQWEIPPEAFTQAGVLEISISLYDVKDGKVVFSWNTPTSTVFSVGSGFEEVPLDLTLPAENEILLICENKQIVAPKGYNNHIANFGDVGTSKVYFQCKKSIAGIDITDESVKAQVLVNFNDNTYQDIIKDKDKEINNIQEISQDSVLIIWNIPDWVTNNDSEYFGNIKISLVFSLNNRYWKTSPISSLYIGETLVRDLDSTATAPTFEEEVTKIVNDVIENNDEIGYVDWEQEDENGIGYITNKPHIKNSVSENGIAEGQDTIAGCKGFNIISISPYGYQSNNSIMTLELDSVEGLDVNDECSIIISSNYTNFGKITEINGSIIKINAYPDTLTAEIIDRTTLGGGSLEPFLFIAKKPLIGTTILPSDSAQHAEGSETYALLRGAHSEGVKTYAIGRYSHAEGNNTQAGYAAHAEGQNSNAIGNVSHSEGANTNATGLFSHAEGSGTTASGEASHAEGGRSTASGYRSHAEGDNTEATNDGAHSEGVSTHATGLGSHAEGIGGNIASGSGSHAEGQTTQAKRGGAHAEGVSTVAHDTGSHAEGYDSDAYAKGSHAEGDSTTYGMYAHAEGQGTTAGSKEKYNNAENKDNFTGGEGAHAEGRYTTASGQAAHAEGNSTVASGAHSHTEGTSSQATAARAHAEGWGTIASADSQHVQGKYNKEDTSKAHIVGGGTGDAESQRKNIHTLDWNGNAWFAGDVFVGGIDQSEGKKLATQTQLQKVERDVENLKEAAIDKIYKIVEYNESILTNTQHYNLFENALSYGYISKLGPAYSASYEFVPESYPVQVTNTHGIGEIILDDSKNIKISYDSSATEDLPDASRPPFQATITFDNIHVMPGDKLTIVLSPISGNFSEDFYISSFDLSIDCLVPKDNSNVWIELVCDSEKIIDDLSINSRYQKELSFDNFEFYLSIIVQELSFDSCPITEIHTYKTTQAEPWQESILITIPQEIIDAGYGLMYNYNIYNYIDFDYRVFIKRCEIKDGRVQALSDTIYIPFSELSASVDSTIITANGLYLTTADIQQQEQSILKIKYIKRA